MTSLKHLAQYCRDYIDLISPSLLSRQAKQIVIPQDMLDATPLYKRDNGIDYESLILTLNLEPQIAQLETDEDPDSDGQERQELSEEERHKLEIARTLDDIYRKYETSSYTKQVSLRFGRVSFLAQSINDTADEEADSNSGYKHVEQHLFSIPVSITFRDYGGARHYSLTIDDTMVTTNAGFLNEFLPQENRDELFKFIAKSEAEEATAIPLSHGYVDELWTKITHFLQQAEARDISSKPDMENVLVILLPKVNYFLSQDLLGIIDAADNEEMLDTSLSAWVDDRDMSINEPSGDDGSKELFFPFPYDNSQLQVLGKLGNRAAVVEGPPGTGKSQTIANILCHLAATGHKVLFVSQKDQAVRGVKDKLKTLDIPYLFGYLPDRSSRLHTEEDEKDSAANSLKGIAQALYSPTTVIDPREALAKLHEYKPQFDASIGGERKYFELHSEWAGLDAYDFGEASPRITAEWYDELNALQAEIKQSQKAIEELEYQQDALRDQKTDQENSAKQTVDKSASATRQFADKTQYVWLAEENELLRGLSYGEAAEMMQQLLASFDAHATDRKSNFIKSTLRNIKLGKELNASIEALPREMYESLREIVFSEDTKTRRYVKLKEIAAYFTAKDILGKREQAYIAKAEEAQQSINDVTERLQKAQASLKKQSERLSALELDAASMGRIPMLVRKDDRGAFASIARRYELQNQLAAFKILNPNLINEEIIREKSSYKSLIRNYLKNRLAKRVEEFRQVKKYRASLESIGRKLSKTKKAYKTFDSLKSNPENFEAMSGIIPIWMMGLDDASRVLPLERNIFDYVIIDEASQCNISYALPAMYRSKHTILFGDTLQMRDTTTAFKSNERLEALANKHNIPEDLQIKASEDSVKSVMDIAKLAGFQTTALRNHYRSPIELIGFSNEWFYEPRGRRLQVVNDDILAMEDGRVLKNHIIAPNPAAELSEKTNVTEAVYIRDVLLPKIKSDPQTSDKSIAILTFFNEQAELLRRVITDNDIKISVIEGIQGDERDIVIYSFVIKSPQEKKRYIALTGESGEIRKEVNEGRVNVAFSRARLQVHAVTSIAPNLWPDGIWIKRYLEYVEERGRVNRLTRAEQHFDSKFEENVYDFLFSKFDPSKYTLTTQVESCGFKIDLVIRNIESGKKLAVECDGPSHFEPGDGQVRVVNDYERQFVLETAGWRFYRVVYSEWLEDESTAKQELLHYLTKYMKQTKAVAEEDAVINEPVYAPIAVDIPTDFVESLRASIATSSATRPFGRKPKISAQKNEDQATQTTIKPVQQTALVMDEAPVANPKPAVPKSVRESDASPNSDFQQLAELELSKRRSMVISRKLDNSIWVNEKLNTDTYKGFTTKGFGIASDDLAAFLEALDAAITSSNFEKEFVVSDRLKLVIYNPDNDTVDIRYHKTSDGYTGYLKKGIRIVKASARKLHDTLQDVA